MRLLLLVLVVILAIDAYSFSGAYTQAAVHEISSGVQRLAAKIDENAPPERPVPPRPIPERTAG